MRHSRSVEHPDGTRLALHAIEPERATDAVCFVHGATYPGSVFDVPGASWLAACATAGNAAFAVDVRGYGDSEAPPELDAAPDANGPVVRADVAAGDVRRALDAIRDRGHDRLHLVGYSWGTMIAGRLVADGGAVDSLTQYAPVHAPAAALVERFDLGDDPPAYRLVTRAAVRDRWAAQRPPGDPPDPAVLDAFWNELAASGQGDLPATVTADAPAVRAPNGTLVDIRDAAGGTPVYDPAAIDVPTLVVRGSLDPTSTRADATGLYDALATDERAYTEVAGGTHFAHLEDARGRLHALVDAFQRAA